MTATATFETTGTVGTMHAHTITVLCGDCGVVDTSDHLTVTAQPWDDRVFAANLDAAGDRAAVHNRAHHQPGQDDLADAATARRVAAVTRLILADLADRQDTGNRWDRRTAWGFRKAVVTAGPRSVTISFPDTTAGRAVCQIDSARVFDALAEYAARTPLELAAVAGSISEGRYTSTYSW